MVQFLSNFVILISVQPWLQLHTNIHFSLWHRPVVTNNIFNIFVNYSWFDIILGLSNCGTSLILFFIKLWVFVQVYTRGWLVFCEEPGNSSFSECAEGPSGSTMYVLMHERQGISFITSHCLSCLILSDGRTGSCRSLVYCFTTVLMWYFFIALWMPTVIVSLWPILDTGNLWVCSLRVFSLLLCLAPSNEL